MCHSGIVDTQNVLLWLEGRHGDACAAGQRHCQQAVRRPPQYAPAPVTLTFDILILNMVSESHVAWATSVPILVFLDLSVLDFGPMNATDRQTSDSIIAV